MRSAKPGDSLVRGTTLTGTVGDQGIAFNQSRGQYMYSFGSGRVSL